ncbi:MAG: hypothetical protein ACR2IF_16940 [Terriglobales bacterium]
MLIKVLYAVLVLSMLALIWAAGMCYLRVRRHWAAKHHEEDHSAISTQHSANPSSS